MKKGFTLVELLVVLAISVVILSLVFSYLHYSLKVAQHQIYQNNKQEAVTIIYSKCSIIRNAINVFADYDNNRLWFQLPAMQNGKLVEPFTNGEWYYLACNNGVLERVQYNSTSIAVSPIDMKIDNETFDFDKKNRQVRIICDIWHEKEDADSTKALRGVITINLLNPLGIFNEEVAPI